MRLYVLCPRTGNRIYLSLAADKKTEVYEFFTVYCPYDGQVHQYRREDVDAEPTTGASLGGAIIGGLIGAVVAGPLGAILVGGIGLATGSNAEQEERRKVQYFREN